MAGNPFWQTLVSATGASAAVTAASDTELCPNWVYTFPAQSFYLGYKFRIHASGIITTTTGSNTMTFTPKLGTTAILASLGAITMIASQTAAKWALDIEITCTGFGASTSTTFAGTAEFRAAPALFATPILLPITGAIGNGTGVDGTATEALHLNGTWSAVSNSITVEQYHVEALLS